MYNLFFRSKTPPTAEVIPIEIHMCFSIFKLAQGAKFLPIAKFFAIGKFMIFLVLHEFVDVIIFKYKFLISWHRGEAMKLVVDEFQTWCGLPNVQGAIDDIHISIVKPFAYPNNYYYRKSNGYSVVAQVVVNCKKILIDVFVGFPKSVNDLKVLCKFSFYRIAQYHSLFASNNSTFQHSFPPYSR
jgi:hypothetical protein